ncbi:MAG: amino acid permease [Hyphomonadaceae bacterium]|nr:amino acid permease [Hyphomonadaceae bacterium]
MSQKEAGALSASDDVKTLHKMGYAQELARRMGHFSNFAISFSIICILSGGINSLAQGTSGAGGAALGIGWLVGGACALLFTLGMAQIASAYPTAGGLYHWSSILGGRFWGWLTAWFNLLGLITVLSAINVGTYYFFIGSFAPMLGVEDTYTTKVVFVGVMTASHALINHLGIKTTTRLTDFSGYLILGGAILLTGALFYYSPSHDFSRLWTFTNYSGDAGGGVWPETSSMLTIFLLGLLLPIYTLTGYDASAHTSEETLQAAKHVPTAIIHSVFWAVLFAWLFSCAFVMAIPDMDQAATQGWNVFFWVMDQIMPQQLKLAIYGIILAAQYICGLATVTSVSRMIFAFARDKGLPFSGTLAKVSPRWRVPVAAIWVGAALAVIFVSWADAYSVAVAVTSIALYVSYAMPIAAGGLAFGGKWKDMGPWNIGPIYRVIALLCVAIAGVIFYIGVQPPNDKALVFLGVIGAITLVVWFGLEMRRFKGPPIKDEEIALRQAQIAAAEKAVGEAV